MSRFSDRLARCSAWVAVVIAAHGAAGAQAVAAATRLQVAAEAARRDADPRLNGSPLDEPARPPSLEAAWTAYEHCHWREAFEAFATMADAGDPEGARMAGAMVRHGAALYRQNFEVAATRLASWRRVKPARTGVADAADAAP